jgi:proteasome accessory factor C
VDRVECADVLDETFPALPTVAPLPTYAPGPQDPRVVLDVGPEGRWVAESYPVESVEVGSGDRDGRLRITLAVSGTAWLERVLLRLGADAEVVTGDPGVGPRAAARLLARYRPSGQRAVPSSKS